MADATELAAHLHRGATRRRRRSSSRCSDSRAPLRRRAVSPSRAAHRHPDTALPELGSHHEATRAPQDTPAPTASPYWFEFPSGVEFSADAATQNFLRWTAFYDIHQSSCPEITKVAQRLVSLGVTSPGRLLGFSADELATLFGQSHGLHQDISSDLMHSSLARRLLALAWQCNNAHFATLQATSSSQPSSDLAVEQLRVNAQLASALDRFAKGNRLPKNPIVRDHESEDDDMEKFDLAFALQKASHAFIPTDWFPSSQLLSKLQKLMLKAQESRKHQNHPFVADTALESWVPMWVGHGESPAARDAMVKQWKKTEGLDTSKFLSLVSNFWLAHAAVGVIQFPDVFAHLLLLIRMIAEHSLSYAIRYERDLHYELQSLTRGSQKFNFSDLLQRPLRRLTHKLDIRHYHSRSQKQFEDPPTSIRDAKRAGTDEVKDSRFTGRQPVCFKHDPAKGRTCPDRSTCKNLHLDTTQAKFAERFASAIKAYKAKKNQTGERL